TNVSVPTGRHWPREDASDVRLEHSNLGASLIDGDTRTQPADHRHIVAGPVSSDVAWIVVQRNPNLCFRRRKAEIRRKNSNYFPPNTLQLDHTPNHRRITGKALLPQRMAQDHIVVSSRNVLAGTEEPA